MSVKTYAARESEIERRWYVVDASDETLGRLASRVAHVLEGKHKPTYQPNLDSGDHVIVLNASRMGMLPRNTLGVQQLRKLKVYAGSDHPHQAQRPEPLA